MGKLGSGGCACALGVLLMIAQSALAEPTTETRQFSVRVDGKPAGSYNMTIRQEGDTCRMNATAEVRVRYLVYTYVYSFRGEEVWKGERLHSLESNTVDEKKHYQVSARAVGEQLQVKVNGQDHVTRHDVWTTTYWRLPAAKFRNQAVPLLDADTGRDIQGVLRFVGMEQVRIGAQQVQCAHWRVTGGVQVDAWYDGQDRLVRQESVEDGHRTSLDLVQLSR